MTKGSEVMDMKSARLDTHKLNEYIENHGFNTSVFAEKIGVSPSCLSRVLNNKRPASGVVWTGLLGFFGRKIFNFIFFNDDVSNDTKTEVAHAQE
jgi:hypothetical protein